ncbi:MAG: GerMN domain-containing protein [Clostridia bacterium]|nr:GerMN domain-containing protein [Clostridia bacterium]
MKKTASIALLLALSLTLTGCTKEQAPQPQAEATLPPAQQRFEVPTAMSDMGYTREVPLYLPATDGSRLLCVYETLSLRHDQPAAPAIAQALLTHPRTKTTDTVGSGTAINLFGEMPVEVAAGVATVNLTSSALSMESSALYKAALSITATLCQQGNIHHVNILIADQAPGLDITGNLPMGALTPHPGEDLKALWELQDAKRTPLGESAENTPYTGAVTLYFPMADGSGVVPEIRTLNFAGQTALQQTETILSALSKGAMYTENAAVMPDLQQLMTKAIRVSDNPSGGRIIHLTFGEDTIAALSESGIDFTCVMASLVMSVTTHVPGVSALTVTLGSEPLTGLMMPDDSRAEFSDGLLRRRAFSGTLRESVSICLAEGELLTTVQRTVPASQAVSPAWLMMLLSQGPTWQEENTGIGGLLPQPLTGEDLLGASVEGDTLVLNLSCRTSEIIRGLTPLQERLFCYAVVGTMCQSLDVKKVAFLFEGEMVESLAGGLFWGGTFMPNPGLASQSKG